MKEKEKQIRDDIRGRADIMDKKGKNEKEQ